MLRKTQMRKIQEVESPLLDVEEACVYGHFKLGTLRDWIQKNKIRYVKRGNRVFFRRKDLDALIDSCCSSNQGRLGNPGGTGISAWRPRQPRCSLVCRTPTRRRENYRPGCWR